MDNSTFLSIAAIVIAFFTFISQTVLGRRTIGVDLYQNVTQMFFEINKSLLIYPNLRPYFYENKDPSDLSAEDYRRAVIIGEMMIDTFEWIIHDISKAANKDRKSWKDYMLSIYKCSPIVRSFHNDNPAWHPLFDQMLHKENVL